MGIFEWLRRRVSRVGAAQADKTKAPYRPPLPNLVLGATSVRCQIRRHEPVLYQTTRREDIEALAAALRTLPPDGGYCMCIGTLVFDLGGTEITLHHGESVRWPSSGGNHVLANPDLVMDWLTARGIRFVREQYEEARRSAAESAEQARRWRAAMPASLQPFFDEMRRGGGSSDPRWTAAIEAEIPDPVERARVLLDLFGSGAGPWSGYPSWESVPEALLVEMPRATLLAAIGEAPEERRREGAVRLFSGWEFRRKPRRRRARLPAPVVDLLVAHVAASGDSAKQAHVRATLLKPRQLPRSQPEPV
jgi:hypothetical protein